MEAPQTLRPPSNWQDFESLCKRLWGEIWNCPEIQKNGRLGQEQFGVDIFGIPLNDDGYYGIQCKGKSEYANNQFTEKEIIDEIEKAKTFEPALKKFYLATTAVNDSKIQTFVRQINLDHKAKGLFEVHIFFWETIVDYIDENKLTHDWYVKNQNYKSTKSVSFTFEDGKTEIDVTPTFTRKVINYTTNKLMFDNPAVNAVLEMQRTFGLFINNAEVNLSYVGFAFQLKNTGTDHLEEYKIFFQIEGEIQDIAETNVSYEIPIIEFHKIKNTFLSKDSMSGKIKPINNILVGDDIFRSDKIYLKPAPKESKVTIKWKLISKYFKDEGELIINVIPEFKRNFEIIIVTDKNLEKIEPSGYEDYKVNKRTEK